jgi:hypothetical protein
MQKKDPTLNIQQLGNLLDRYKRHLKPPQASVEKECIYIIKELYGFVILPQQVSYSVSTKTLHIKTPSIMRSELVMKYPEIIHELKQRLGESAPQMIV